MSGRRSPTARSISLCVLLVEQEEEEEEEEGSNASKTYSWIST